MPTIHESDNWKIAIYFFDHAPPHFHIVTPDGEVQVTIADLNIIAGSLPVRKIANALAWAAANRAILEAKWKEYSR